MEIFGLDLGNKQTKLKSSKQEYVLPSRFLNQADMPSLVGGNSFGEGNDLQTFKVPFNDDTFIWGNDIANLHLDEYLYDTIMYDNRYSSGSFKLLANFALGKLASDFSKANSGVMEVEVVAGIPTEDYSQQKQIQDFSELLKGQHEVTINGKIMTIRVNKVYILPQPVGTLYDEYLDNKSSIKNETLPDEKVGIVDIGGGTILIDTILNFMLSSVNRAQYNTGINNLYENIASSIDGKVSLAQLEQELRAGSKEQGWSYRFSKNNQKDITDLVCKQIDRFTRQLITNVSSTLKNLNIIDTLYFTGGGTNLLNKALLKAQFEKVEFVENTELANVRGFYKFGLNQINLEKEER